MQPIALYIIHRIQGESWLLEHPWEHAFHLHRLWPRLQIKLRVQWFTRCRWRVQLDVSPAVDWSRPQQRHIQSRGAPSGQWGDRNLSNGGNCRDDDRRFRRSYIVFCTPSVAGFCYFSSILLLIITIVLQLLVWFIRWTNSLLILDIIKMNTHSFNYF